MHLTFCLFIQGWPIVNHHKHHQEILTISNYHFSWWIYNLSYFLSNLNKWVKFISPQLILSTDEVKQEIGLAKYGYKHSSMIKKVSFAVIFFWLNTTVSVFYSCYRFTWFRNQMYHFLKTFVRSHNVFQEK